MVVFGAGASYDSIPAHRLPSREASRDETESRPPLATELFAERTLFNSAIGRYPACGALIRDRLRSVDQKTTTIEATLDVLAQEAPTSRTVRRELVALRFYLRDVLWECGLRWSERAPGQTNYHALLRRICIWQERTQARVSLVSFNYDLLVDEAMEAHPGRRLATLDSYLADPEFALFKPHGSVNWAHATDELSDQLGPLAAINAAGDAAGGLPVTTGMHVVSRNADGSIPNDVSGANQGVLSIPALTVPILSKLGFEMPPYHEEQLRRALGTVTKLLVIGWRATEENFIALWHERPRESRPMLQVVGTHTADETAKRLIHSGTAANSVPSFTGGFTEYLASGHLEDFLTMPLPGL